MIKNLISRLFSKAHVHQWKTTRVNKWQHPTVQECRCGMTRKCVQHEKGEYASLWKWDWEYSDGTKSVHSRGWDEPHDWGDHFGFSTQDKRIEIKNQ